MFIYRVLLVICQQCYKQQYLMSIIYKVLLEQCINSLEFIVLEQYGIVSMQSLMLVILQYVVIVYVLLVLSIVYYNLMYVQCVVGYSVLVKLLVTVVVLYELQYSRVGSYYRCIKILIQCVWIVQIVLQVSATVYQYQYKLYSIVIVCIIISICSIYYSIEYYMSNRVQLSSLIIVSSYRYVYELLQQMLFKQ